MAAWNRGLSLAVAVMALTGCSASIQHGLDETGANETVAALERSGIRARKIAEEGGAHFQVQVAQADATRAIDQLRTLGLPRQRRHGFSEVYGQPSLIPTASEERARYLDALAGEIERTLEIVEGVVAARVHLVLEEVDPLATADQPRVPARAAVLLKTLPGRRVPLGEAEVQKLVAGSVPGLEAAAVAVVMTTAPEPMESAAPPADSQLARAASSPVLVAAAGAGLMVAALLAVLLMVTARRLAALQNAVRSGGAQR